MKSLFSKIYYLLFSFFIFNVSELKADDYSLDNFLGQSSELLIESNNQKSDLKSSIFFAEGNVIITNKNNEFIAKSQRAIFYKLIGKIKLIGNVEFLSSDLNEIKAGEIIYYLKENKFEAISDENQRVNTKLRFNGNKKLNQLIEK